MSAQVQARGAEVDQSLVCGSRMLCYHESFVPVDQVRFREIDRRSNASDFQLSTSQARKYYIAGMSAHQKRLCNSCVNGLRFRMLGKDANMMGFSRMQLNLFTIRSKRLTRFGLLHWLMIGIVWRWVKRKHWCRGGEGSAAIV